MFLFSSRLIRSAVLSIGLLSTSLTFAGEFFAFGDFVARRGRRPADQDVTLVSDVNEVPQSGIVYDPLNTRRKTLRLGQVHTLKVTYKVLEGDIRAGSPRVAIGVDVDGDGSVDGNIYIYLGDPPTFTQEAGGFRSTGNLAATDVRRVDASEIEPGLYGTFDEVADELGDARVEYVVFLVEGGYAQEFGVQTLQVSDFAVNADRLKVRQFRRGETPLE